MFMSLNDFGPVLPYGSPPCRKKRSQMPEGPQCLFGYCILMGPLCLRDIPSAGFFSLLQEPFSFPDRGVALVPSVLYPQQPLWMPVVVVAVGLPSRSTLSRVSSDLWLKLTGYL